MTVLHSLPYGLLSGLDKRAELNDLLEELYYAGAISDQLSAVSTPPPCGRRLVSTSPSVETPRRGNAVALTAEAELAEQGAPQRP